MGRGADEETEGLSTPRSNNSRPWEGPHLKGERRLSPTACGLQGCHFATLSPTLMVIPGTLLAEEALEGGRKQIYPLSRGASLSPPPC